MEVTQENRRALLQRMKQWLDQFKKTPDVGDEDYDWEAEEGIRQLAKETRNALRMREEHGDSDDADEASAENPDMAMEVDKMRITQP